MRKIRKCILFFIIMSCITACNKIKTKDIKEQIKKAPEYVDNLKHTRNYGVDQEKKIARYIAKGEKRKFLNEMSVNTMTKKGAKKKIDSLFNKYITGNNVKVKHMSSTAMDGYELSNFKFSDDKGQCYNFWFEYVPMDAKDKNNIGIRTFKIYKMKGKENYNKADPGIEL